MADPDAVTIHRALWQFRLPWITPPLSQNGSRGSNPHVHAAKVRRAMEAARFTIRAQRLPVLASITCELHWVPARNGRRDPINVTATLKVVEDAMVLEGVIPDDTPKYCTSVMPIIHPANPRDPHMYVRVLNLDPAGLVLADRAIPRPTPSPKPRRAANSNGRPRRGW